MGHSLTKDCENLNSFTHQFTQTLVDYQAARELFLAFRNRKTEIFTCKPGKAQGQL